MNFFDFFKKKPDPQDDELNELLKEAARQKQPRPHHYEFAHRAIREIAFHDPVMFLAVAASPKANEFLEDILKLVEENRTDATSKPDFTATDIHLYPTCIGAYPCAILEMPEPEGTTEAFFTAFVVLADLAEGQEGLENAEARYFTLEKGFHIDGNPRTVLGEWRKDGSHLNYGDGPLPLLTHFSQRIAEAIGVELE